MAAILSWGRWVKKLACHLFSTMQLSKPMLIYHQQDLIIYYLIKSFQNSDVFNQTDAVATILDQGDWALYYYCDMTLSQ